MHKFLSGCIIACMLVQASLAIFPMSAAGSGQSLANLFFNSRLAHQDPALAVKCFMEYNLQMKTVIDNYGSEYNRCILDAKDARKAVDNEMVDKRNTITASSQEICQSLTTCTGLNSTLEMFTCHGQIGANNTKAVYTISGNASEYATLMREKYRTINVRHEKCSTACERTYIDSTAHTYRRLQSCLGGQSKPLPPSSTTTPVPTTAITSPTLPVSSTTEAGSTEAIPTELPVVTEPTVLPDTEEFAKLLKLFK